MSSTTASTITETYLASGLHEWLSDFGTVYYNPEAATDSNNINKTYTVTDGDYHPDAIIDFNSGELAALTTIDGADWQAASRHLESFWQANNDHALEPTCFDMPDGQQFLDGILAVSPYSVLGALCNTDTFDDESFPDSQEYANARPLTMMYKHQAVQWTKEHVKDIATDTSGGAVGPDFIGVLVAQTTGQTDNPIGLLSEVDNKSLNWKSTTTLFVE